MGKRTTEKSVRSPDEARELHDLIQRLKADTQGSRELDVAIYVREFPHPCVELHPDDQRAFDEQKAPHYTTSIHDAMTLNNSEVARSMLFTLVGEDCERMRLDPAKHAARLYCIRALQARTEQE